MVKLLFQRLLNRGYEESTISPIFNEAALKIGAKFITSRKRKTELLQGGNRIFSTYNITKEIYPDSVYEMHMKAHVNPLTKKGTASNVILHKMMNT